MSCRTSSVYLCFQESRGVLVLLSFVSTHARLEWCSHSTMRALTTTRYKAFKICRTEHPGFKILETWHWRLTQNFWKKHKNTSIDAFCYLWKSRLICILKFSLFWCKKCSWNHYVVHIIQVFFQFHFVSRQLHFISCKCSSWRMFTIVHIVLSLLTLYL